MGKEHSNHQELVEAIQGWLSDALQMGEVASLAQAQVKRIESAQRYFDAMLGPEAGHSARLERRALQAREALTAYLFPLKRILGGVLSFDPQGTHRILPQLLDAYQTMKEAYDRLQEVEQAEQGPATDERNLPIVGILELGGLVDEFLQGLVPTRELVSAIEKLQMYLSSCHAFLTERLADLETQDGVELLVRAATDGLVGYESGYNALQVMLLAIRKGDLDGVQSCQQELLETAEHLKRARAWADDATEEGWLNWQEAYSLEADVSNQPDAAEVEAEAEPSLAA